MSNPARIETASDLLSWLKDRDALAYKYVRLLKRCADGGYPIGMQDETENASAVTDWEAAACLKGSLTVAQITETRRGFREGMIVEDGHRGGHPTYRLSDELIDH